MFELCLECIGSAMSKISVAEPGNPPAQERADGPDRPENNRNHPRRAGSHGLNTVPRWWFANGVRHLPVISFRSVPADQAAQGNCQDRRDRNGTVSRASPVRRSRCTAECVAAASPTGTALMAGSPPNPVLIVTSGERTKPMRKSWPSAASGVRVAVCVKISLRQALVESDWLRLGSRMPWAAEVGVSKIRSQPEQRNVSPRPESESDSRCNIVLVRTDQTPARRLILIAQPSPPGVCLR